MRRSIRSPGPRHRAGGLQSRPADRTIAASTAVNVPVVSRADYALDLAAPGGSLPSSEAARLDAWFRSLQLGYGDSIYVDGPDAYDAKADVARVAGQYGLLVSNGAPVTAGAIQPGTVRVVVSRARASVPGCPNWSVPSQPNLQNASMSNFGCAVNSNLAAMVANPEDLVHGREGSGVGDTQTATKAVGVLSQCTPPTGQSRPEGHQYEEGQLVMNAPFQARAGLRDPFTAFVCDDATADMLRPVAVEHGWSPEKVHKGGLRNAVQSLSVSASPTILFVDLSESADPLNDINALAEVCEPGTVVIASGQVNDVRLYRDLVASGIHDYLLKPFTVDQLRDTFAHAQSILSGPRGEAQADKPHVMTAVIGVRGGVGASTIATSLAWLMGEKAHRSTALLDLDVHFGTGALALDLEPGRGLTDAIENPSRIDGLFIERAMIRANERLSVLSAEAPLHQPLITDGTAFFQLQEEMKNAFESTVLDLPRQMLIQYPHMVHDAHVAVVVSELTLAGDARHDPGARLAQVERAADQGHRRGQPRADRRRARNQQEGFRAVDRARRGHRLPGRPQDCGPGGQAGQADGRDRDRQDGRALHPAVEHGAEPCQRGRRRGRGQAVRRRQVAGRQSEVDAGQAERQGCVTHHSAREGFTFPPAKTGRTNGRIMIYIIIVAIGVLGALLLGGKAMGGPNPRKSLKRRVELIKERHAEGGVLAANAQAQIRKLMAARAGRVEGFASTLIPKPALMRKRLDQTGKDISLGKYAMASLGLAAFVAALLMIKGAPFLLAFFVGLFAGVGIPHFVIGFLIKRRINKFNCQLPGCDRTDGPRPSLGPADHRNAGHCCRRNLAARSASNSAPFPTR